MRAAVGRAGIAEQLAEKIGQEVGEYLLLFEAVGLARRKQIGPVRELGPQRVNVGRQLETGKMSAENVGAEQRFGFDGHG